MENEKKYEQQRNEFEKEIMHIDIPEDIKSQLLQVNQQFCSLALHGLFKNLYIVIENVEKKVSDLVLDYLLLIWKTYQEDIEEITLFDKRFQDEESLTEKNLLVVQDFYSFQSEVLHFYRARDFFSDLNRSQASFILTCEDFLKPHYTSLFNEKSFPNKMKISICGTILTTQDILEQLFSLYKKNGEKVQVTEERLQKIVQSVLKQKLCFSSNCSTYLYHYSYNQRILLGQDVIDEACFPTFEKEESKKRELKDLVGLSNVKKEIMSLKNYLAFQKKLEKPIDSIYLNMLFLGNPGTGKTTVGKIFANMLYELGYIKEDKVIEIVPNDLIAKYVGHTKEQTREILEDARGGVLFIDEAYLIADTNFSSGQASFMKEAVVELLKYMENPENVIIFAGYPKETLRLYESNPGFQSRICKEIYFDDYTEEELTQILKKQLSLLGLRTNAESEREIKEVFKREKGKRNFGNARFCETYMQTILMNHANQCLEKENYLIDKEDVLLKEKSIPSVGFLGGR